MRTFPDPEMSTPPCDVADPMIAAGSPLIKTLELPDIILAPQLVESPMRAAGAPLIKTLGEPVAMLLTPGPV